SCFALSFAVSKSLSHSTPSARESWLQVSKISKIKLRIGVKTARTTPNCGRKCAQTTLVRRKSVREYWSAHFAHNGHPSSQAGRCCDSDRYCLYCETALGLSGALDSNLEGCPDGSA